ncbi:MAG TPA: ABC transporter ATP-binding protein, partial [Nitrospiraceae bacterium]
MSNYPLMPRDHRTSWELLRRLWTYISPFHWRLATLLVVMLSAIPLNLLKPFPLTLAVDSVIDSKPLPHFLQPWVPSLIQTSTTAMLTFVFSAYVIIALCNHLQGRVLWMLCSLTGERMILSFRSRLFEHLQRICTSYHDTKGSADSVYRLQHDAACVKQIPIDAGIPLVRDVCMLAGIAILMIIVDWQFALVALTMMPLLFWLTRRCSRRLKETWSNVKSTESETVSCVQEVFGSPRVVKAFGREDHEHRRFLGHATEWVKQHNTLASIGSGFDFTFGMSVAIGTATALIVGIEHVKTGRLSMGDLLLLMAYMAQFSGPLDTATKKLADMQSYLVGFQRALAVLDIPPLMIDQPTARPVVRAQGRVAFRGVSFGYMGKAPVLRRISFSVPAGTRVGIVGVSGGGKSTLVSLLTRFVDPQEGCVLLDGLDVRQYRLADLRRQFAIVPQEPMLFSRSIADNIRYGNPHATQADIETAAKAAHADAFIRVLPHGYQTHVGAGGARLSGGERQRIALARAFLRNAPIVILDEPTSALDAQTEVDLIEVMGRLMCDRTTFLITHRLTALKHCDLQLLLRDGRASVQALD